MSGEPVTQSDLEEVRADLEQRVADAERAAEKAEEKVVEVGQYSACRWCGILYSGNDCPLCRLVRLNKLKA